MQVLRSVLPLFLIPDYVLYISIGPEQLYENDNGNAFDNDNAFDNKRTPVPLTSVPSLSSVLSISRTFFC